MDTVGHTSLWTFVPGNEFTETATCGQVRKQKPYPVQNYLDLAQRIAELQFRNKDLVLFFRGQTSDHKNKGSNTTIKPSILRGSSSREDPSEAELNRRFSELSFAEDQLISAYTKYTKFGLDVLKRQRVLRWTLLQHYEVVPTPLLDVTTSLRIAASFASNSNKDSAVLMVLGVPQISGAVSVSAEAGIQTIRLSSVSPPTAIRPHIQEGYLIGEYPELSDLQQKTNYRHVETDFGRRLVAKFSINLNRFWMEKEGFPAVPPTALYPDRQDPFYSVAQDIKNSLR